MKARVQKQNVLWIVHATARKDERHSLELQQRLFGNPGQKWKVTEEYEKRGQMKNRVDLFYEGIVNAMKIAQDKGMAIVVQGPKLDTPLIKMARKAGVDTKQIHFTSAQRNVKDYLKKEGISPGHFFVGGYYRNMTSGCVWLAADGLRNSYKNRVSLLLGTPSLRISPYAVHQKEYKGFNIATLNTLRTQKTLVPPERVSRELIQDGSRYSEYIRSLRPRNVAVRHARRRV